MTQDFLLEMGCEELPADYLPSVLDWNTEGPAAAGGLASTAASFFEVKGMVWKELQSFGTPRRLVLHVRGMEPEVKKEEKGPPAHVAFDAQGQPTRAAEAFAEKYGVKVSQLIRRETPKGPVVFAENAVPVSKILEEIIPQMIGKIVFPKKMRWDESGVQFARPIRWILSLHGSKVVRCAFGNLRGGRVTYGTRRSQSQRINVKSPSAYFDSLKKLGIELEQGLSYEKNESGLKFEEPYHLKEESLRRELQKKAQRAAGKLADEKSEEFKRLLSTATFLAENPVIEMGTFLPEYQDLPPEVLATAMAKHLKLFSVHTPDGKKLLPKFLAVLEGKPTKTSVVIANIERILEARFSDARFFYREDTRTPLEAKVSELGKVVFHEKLGSVAERIPRLVRLMTATASQGPAEDRIKEWIPRLAQLCKADLMTQMVREFPSLQGIMGGRYSALSGEPPEISAAIPEVYQPRAASDPLPATALGAVGSLADRVDALVGFFGVGLKPTGSADPYALRRQAMGLVRILTGPKISFVGLSIDRLFDEGIQSWGSRLSVDPAPLKKQLRAFLCERFEWLAWVHHSIDRELIAAVLAAGDDDLADAWARLIVLRDLWRPDQRKAKLLKAAKVAERTGRMVKSVKGDGLGRVNPEIFKEPSEKKLWETWNRVAPLVEEQIQRRDYAQAVETYGSLYPEVHQFFEMVFVMDENLDVRRNRLALINEIHQLLCRSFADLSKLPLSGLE